MVPAFQTVFSSREKFRPTDEGPLEILLARPPAFHKITIIVLVKTAVCRARRCFRFSRNIRWALKRNGRKNNYYDVWPTAKWTNVILMKHVLFFHIRVHRVCLRNFFFFVIINSLRNRQIITVNRMS